MLPRLEKLATRARHAAVRLIVTIPEVNLVDWQSHQPSPVLPNGRESDWHDALANLDAPRMCAVDDSATATSRRLAGSTDEPGPNQLARYCNEVGAACGPLRAVTTSPMASREIQQLLREWVDDHGFASVDVPALIGSMGSGEPDRTWFLDYCHHTGDRGGGRSGRRCRRYYRTNRTDSPPAELRAVAALGALMHTDHRLVSSIDRRPLLRHWKSVAEEAFEGTDDLIKDLVESRIGSAALPLTQAQRRNQTRPFPYLGQTQNSCRCCCTRTKGTTGLVAPSQAWSTALVAARPRSRR